MLAACLAAGALLWCCACGSPRERRSLWPGTDYSVLDREDATRRALAFIYQSSKDARNFETYGSDYLWCFRSVSITAADPNLNKLARDMGVERAQAWRAVHRDVPDNATADEIADLVFGADAADRLGVFDLRYKEQLAEAAKRHTAREYLDFDPSSEPPPADVPRDCTKCGSENPRGSSKCRRCGNALEFESRYEVWTDAMVITSAGEQHGTPLGSNYAEVVAWLPRMRPYPSRQNSKSEYSDALTAVTHLVYTLTAYSQYRLRPEWLPEEVAFLRAALPQAIQDDDPEGVGECADSLRVFGLTEADPEIRSAMNYLFAKQRQDGTWAKAEERDPYNLYHAAWTGLDGLRQYIFKGDSPIYMGVRDRLHASAK